jgi:putative heme iron utilization protein
MILGTLVNSLLQYAMAEPHVPRLTIALRQLLAQQRVAALATLDEEGHPFVSMVPFALELQSGLFVLHVSALAPHTANMLRQAHVSLLVMQSESVGEPVHALPRVTWLGMAQTLDPESATATTARAAYLQRFPEAEPMTQLGDFRFVGIKVHAARQVAGFGAARALDAQAIAEILAVPG